MTKLQIVEGSIYVQRDSSFRLLRIGDEKYFRFTDSSDRSWMIREKCPHRGGPLRLGCLQIGSQGYEIKCPWHGMVVKERVFLKGALEIIEHEEATVIVVPWKLSDEKISVW